MEPKSLTDSSGDRRIVSDLMEASADDEEVDGVVTLGLRTAGTDAVR